MDDAILGGTHWLLLAQQVAHLVVLVFLGRSDSAKDLFISSCKACSPSPFHQWLQEYILLHTQTHLLFEGGQRYIQLCTGLTIPDSVTVLRDHSWRDSANDYM